MNGLASAPTPLAQLGHFRRFAHHPDCARYDHHLVRPFGVPLCLGCVGMYTGIVAGIVGVLATWPPAGHLTLFAGSLLCYVPTFGQPTIRRRWYKIPSRILLGFGFALGGTSLLLAPWSVAGWAFRIVAVTVTWGLYLWASKLRATHSDDPCRACPWGSFPLCAHNLPRLRLLLDHESDPGQRAFLASLVADLEPLAAIPPNFQRFPEPAPRQVGFAHDDRAS